MDQTIVPLRRRELRLAGYPANGALGTAEARPTKVEERQATARKMPGRLAPAWLGRLNLHLAVASIPVLAISAHVFWLVSLRTVALFVLLPLVAMLTSFNYGSA